MYGRKCDAIPLLNLSKTYTTYPCDQSSEDESIQIDSQVDPYAVEHDNIDDIGDEVESIRQQTRQRRV